MKLDAKTGSLGVRRGGAWLATLGLTAMVTGAVLLAVTSAQSSDREIIPPALTYGLLGGGALVTAGGITMIVVSGTHVKDDHGTEIGKLGPPPGSTGRAFIVPAAFVF